MSFYFAYGSNINPYHINKICKNITAYTIGLLKDYELYFQKSNLLKDSYCNIVHNLNDDSKVFGIIYYINNEDEYELDKKEYFGLVYRKINIVVKDKDDNVYNCWTYQMINSSLECTYPSLNYYNLVRNGYLFYNIPLIQLYQALLKSDKICNILLKKID